MLCMRHVGGALDGKLEASSCQWPVVGFRAGLGASVQYTMASKYELPSALRMVWMKQGRMILEGVFLALSRRLRAGLKTFVACPLHDTAKAGNTT